MKNKKTQPSIYLAGGFSSNWQEKAKSALNGWKIFDPSSHKLKDPKEYTHWDLKAIEKTDIVLAYMEKDNPGGYSLALEVGYAKALHKKIILVEKHPSGDRRRYFEMVRETSDLNFSTLSEALNYLSASNPNTTL